MPNHLHCLWQLPESDDDFSGRWREIKKYVSKRISADGKRPREKDIWQRRFWKHAIRDEDDWRRHVDYFARLMECTAEIKCSEFGDAMIRNM